MALRDVQPLPLRGGEYFSNGPTGPLQGRTPPLYPRGNTEFRLEFPQRQVGVLANQLTAAVGKQRAPRRAPPVRHIPTLFRPPRACLTRRTPDSLPLKEVAASRVLRPLSQAASTSPRKPSNMDSWTPP